MLRIFAFDFASPYSKSRPIRPIYPCRDSRYPIVTAIPLPRHHRRCHKLPYNRHQNHPKECRCSGYSPHPSCNQRPIRLVMLYSIRSVLRNQYFLLLPAPRIIVREQRTMCSGRRRYLHRDYRKPRCRQVARQIVSKETLENKKMARQAALFVVRQP